MRAVRDDVEVVRPADRAAWRAWLVRHHTRADGVLVEHVRQRSSLPGPRYEDIVEEALCFGWIDGTARSVDEDHTGLYVAPRRPGSVWAGSNKERVERLEAAGLMTEAGRAAVDRARQDGSWTVLDGPAALLVPDDLAAALATASGARDGFDALAPSLRRQLLAWVAMARRPDTRQRRIAAVVEGAREGRSPLS